MVRAAAQGPVHLRSFLQQHPSNTTAKDEKPLTSLGQLLLDFLEVYGKYFNYQCLGQVGVSLAPPPNLPQPQPRGPPLVPDCRGCHYNPPQK